MGVETVLSRRENSSTRDREQLTPRTRAGPQLNPNDTVSQSNSTTPGCQLEERENRQLTATHGKKKKHTQASMKKTPSLNPRAL